MFARREVEALAGPRAFERGLLYAANGRVGKVKATDASVTAKVRGSSAYQVSLSVNADDDDDEPVYECSCPVGVTGRFCKHAAALALVATDSVPGPSAENDKPIDLRAYLASLDQPALVELLLERAAADDVFDARLRLAAARVTAGPPPLGVFRHALDEAFVVRDFVDYRQMHDYASTIASALDSLQELLDDGHAEAVITLTEHAIDRAEDALGYVDDSDGYLSGIGERLQELHLDACALARPEPIALARTLFDRERHSGDLDVFHNAAATYAELLGTDGIAEYRRLADAEWNALPPLGPGQEERSYSSRRFRITHIMESLAELAGDVDAVVDVLARDQSSAYQFVRIAELYRKAGRYDDALAWAEKGLALHGGSDSRLVEAAAEEYHRAGRGAEAVRVAWDAYDAAPALATYRQLAEQAARAGLWPDRHDKAIALLRRVVQGQAKPARGRTSQWAARGPDGSTLVEVLLYDGNVELAWTEASDSGCRRALWLELARRREGEHPLEAMVIWQGEIEQVIDAKNNQAYAEAVNLIVRVRRLMTAAGREADFAPYVAKLRTTHKPKRNLMKLFDERSW